MLHTEEIIKTVSSEVSKYKFPLVVDPVMIAKSGVHLLKPEAVDALENYLLPEATVITPNRFEAEKLADIKIESLRDAEIAAEKISEIGPKAVLIKGGHLEESEAIDVLYYKGEFKRLALQDLMLKLHMELVAVFQQPSQLNSPRKQKYQWLLKRLRKL